MLHDREESSVVSVVVWATEKGHSNPLLNYFLEEKKKGKDQWCGIVQVDKSDEKSVSQDNVSLLSFFSSQWSNDDWTHLTFVFMNVSTSIVTSCK